MDIFNLTFSDSFPLMIVRFIILILVTWAIVHKLYYRKSHRRDFYFSFMLMSVAIFFLVYFMIFELEDLKTKTSIGIGIGLFGIFSIMRYRTDAMPVREMTYMFIIIALSVINAIANNVSLVELLLTNTLIFSIIWICECRLKQAAFKLVQYDRIDLITPDKHNEMKADLTERLGIDVLHVEVGSVDFIRDMAMLKVYYSATASDSDLQQRLQLSKEDKKQFT
ncbi:DUF4956 domain-containing protein [Leyella stercorea]|uniref:DUF4956 domain-containing protein n=1 Tax=Leyella stercorea TaxID=363265 RepID=UPI003AB36953